MKFLILISCLIGFNVFAQDLSPTQKAGACSSYHMLWYTISLKSNSFADASFSENIFTNLQNKFKGNKEFNDTADIATKNLVNAVQTQNFNLVKSFAGICAEIGIPIGQNTKR